MLRKLIWAAMHSRYFPFVQFQWQLFIPIDWQIRRERGYLMIEVWTIKRPEPIYFPWEVDRAFKSRTDLNPWQPPPLPTTYDPSAPDYDDIPF